VAAVTQSINRLTVRSKNPYRTDPVPVSVEDSITDLMSSSRLVLLIHGFANTEPEAHGSYAAFQENLSAALGISLPSGMVWEFHWPGGFDESKLMAFVRYPGTVKAAGWSGDRLARFLHNDPRVGKHQQLYVVAHSLGCRVILQALLTISEEFGEDYNGPAITDVALLAAAVSSTACRPDIGYFLPLPRTREHVFYSDRDTALRPRYFDVGQRVSGEPYERGSAVGRTGMPDRRWYASGPTCLDHKEYWRAGSIARAVGGILGTAPVELPQHCLPEDQSDPAPPLPALPLPEQTLPARG
jgi:esterase/lipase superfamily enzyme